MPALDGVHSMNDTAMNGQCPVYRRDFDPSEIPSDIREFFEEVLVYCGSPWARVVERTRTVPPNPSGNREAVRWDCNPVSRIGEAMESRHIGWQPTCACPEHLPIPQTVLDPFAGAGTTLLVADRLRRNAIGIELNPQYARLARDRVHGDAPLFAEVAE